VREREQIIFLVFFYEKLGMLIEAPKISIIY